MRTIDLSPLYRSFIGFDRLASTLDSASQNSEQTTYPPYNIELLGEDKYLISMAIAGFSKDDVTIEVVENTLVVAGKMKTGSDAAEADDKQTQQRKFLHKGISERSFERKFQLSDHVNVTGAALEHGLLNISLEREIPEEKKPRQIEIGGRLLENKH
ncbi:Hsp20 family protein [Alteromonas gilva]|uniref:Hsp20 family protein n=1 Tax=Alteromonas gilva TaxID=2987522 RepID=A0ABT5L2B5_9ALTE|nr:Hsp20 family protein [Alteromonas gilva]MDC8830541.1 Hsp20 family protein [Alteromonas gilva]